MYFDFTTVAFDQLLSNAAKSRYMFGGQTKVPLTLFARSGGGTGHAAQHSSAFYSILAHIPGLKVVVPSDAYSVRGLLAAAIRDDDPVFVVSDKKLINLSGFVPDENFAIELGKGRYLRKGSDVTLVGMSYTSVVCKEAADKLSEEGIDCEVVDLLSLSPLDESILLESVSKTNRLIVVDEDTPRCSMASEVAAVVADNYHIAEQALELIEVDYEILEPVLEIREALKDGSPVLHDTFSPGGFLLQTEKSHSNAGSFKLSLGNADRAFRNADHVLEETFETHCLHQGYIEPHSVTIEWGQDDIVNVWTSTQGHFAIREQLAFILQHPLNKVKVIPMEIGGGFGGKDQVYIEPIAAMFAKNTGRPVKIAMSRADVFRGTGPSPGANIRVKLAAKKDGTLLATDITLSYEAGAYPGGPVTSAALQSTARSVSYTHLTLPTNREV